LQAVYTAVSSCKQVEEVKELFRLSTTDSLTNIYNRRYMFELGDKAYLAAKRYKRNLSVLMTDIDFFKKFNDTYGHNTGDEVLRAVANTLSKSVRQNIDVVGRYGGEEFGVILPETDLESAKQLAERLRKNVEELRLVEQYPELSVTISIGVAMLDEKEALDDVFKRADEKLYEAKKNGRNRVEG
jgi:diguanylate cyclase (GGDEF)-like protein